MTESEKRIREMAEIIEKRRLEARVTVGSLNEGAGMWYARDLYMKGYRKQSDTVREVLQKLIYNITVNNTDDGYLDESIDFLSTIDDIKALAAEYGVEVEE